MPSSLASTFSRIETFFDDLKLGYKWKYDRWKELQIITYRGYGTRDRVMLKGRVLDDKGATIGETPENVWKNLANTWRRFETDEIPGATVAITLGSERVELITDEDGFFETTLELSDALPEKGPWHTWHTELLKPESDDPVVEEGHVIVPQDDTEYVIVSDLDDTIIKTGATDSLRMFRTVIMNNAHTRIPFPGVGAFYRALKRGPNQRGHNPTFYVSSSPWNLYDMFEAFIDMREIPLGPIFLKDFGFSEGKFIKTGHQGHKSEHINRLLKTYPSLQFVLVGDSGQQDPEIYREIAREQPERIRAIYVRDVTPPKRDREVHDIAAEVNDLGVTMVLVENTVEAAEHAARTGLIHEDALAEIRETKVEDELGHQQSRWKYFLGISSDGESG